MAFYPNYRIAEVHASIRQSRMRLLSHPLYSRIASLDDVHIFMQSHVFAVWDFMSLLKRLQQDLTCVAIPWIPVGDAEVRFLINEIVCGEESDVDQHGGRISHFELYQRAMLEAGADTGPIVHALNAIRKGRSPTEALYSANAPAAAVKFSDATFRFAANGKVHQVAAAFTFGREDLIPDMFTLLISQLCTENPGKLNTFRYYLERHIEVDSGPHSNIALRMVELLCGSNDLMWDEVAATAVASIKSRIRLWDDVLISLNKR